MWYVTARMKQWLAKTSCFGCSIESLDMAEAERVKQQDGTPSLKFGKTDASEQILLLTVTGDF